MFTLENEAKKEMIDYHHNKKVEMEKLKQEMFIEKQKIMNANVNNLWALKFKFLKEQDELQTKRIEKVFELKHKTAKKSSVVKK